MLDGCCCCCMAVLHRLKRDTLVNLSMSTVGQIPEIMSMFLLLVIVADVVFRN